MLQNSLILKLELPSGSKWAYPRPWEWCHWTQTGWV